MISQLANKAAQLLRRKEDDNFILISNMGSAVEAGWSARDDEREYARMRKIDPHYWHATCRKCDYDPVPCINCQWDECETDAANKRQYAYDHRPEAFDRNPDLLTEQEALAEARAENPERFDPKPADPHALLIPPFPFPRRPRCQDGIRTARALRQARYAAASNHI